MTNPRQKQISSFQSETIRKEQFVRANPDNRPDYNQEGCQGG